MIGRDLTPSRAVPGSSRGRPRSLRKAGAIVPLAVLLLGGICAAPAHATVTTDFTGITDFTPSPGISLAAEVKWTVSGNNLDIEINNQSPNAKIGGVWFNGAPVTFSSTITATPSSGFGGMPTIKGNGSPQVQSADGFGKFGYVLDFDNGLGGRFLESKDVTFHLTFTGTLTESSIKNGLSTGGGLGAFQAALEWFPDTGLTGWGGPGPSFGPTPTPEPATALAAVIGLIPVGFLALRRRVGRVTKK